ncbi:MAG: chromate efflux transporter [Caldilineaceae bacterium]
MMQTEPPPSLLHLFAAFGRLGMTAFGGPSMVAYIRKLAVEKKCWLDAPTFAGGVALCQMIPGATAMQTAAYVGLTTRGISGAAASFVGFGLPAFLLMLAFAILYTYTSDLPIVISAFSGLQAIIVAIVANATIMFGRSTIKDWRALAIAVGAALLFGLNVTPAAVVLAAALAGLLLVKPKQAPPNRPSVPAQTRTNVVVLLITLGVVGAGLLLLALIDQTLFELSTLLARIDLLAFGGGFASVPLMYHEVVDVRHWVDSQTFMNGMVLGQITPGPVVITATFIGYLLGGLPGAVVGTVSVLLPSFLLVIAIAPYFDRMRATPAFNKAIGGVLCSFVGLLLVVTIRFAVNIQWDPAHFVLAALALAALLYKVDILWVVAAGTLVSILIFR